jgi:hypothetical protein
MLENQTIAKLYQMKLTGMARACEVLCSTRKSGEMTDEEIISYLTDAEWDDRQNKKLERLVKSARFRYQASVEEIAFTV